MQKNLENNPVSVYRVPKHIETYVICLWFLVQLGSESFRIIYNINTIN